MYFILLIKKTFFWEGVQKLYQTATEIQGTKTCWRTMVKDKEVGPERRSEPHKITQKSQDQNLNLPTLPACDDLTDSGEQEAAGSERTAQLYATAQTWDSSGNRGVAQSAGRWGGQGKWKASLQSAALPAQPGRPSEQQLQIFIICFPEVCSHGTK